jgi:ApaG protein
MSLKKIQTQNISVNVVTVFVPSESDESQKKYFFAYKISIKNNGSEPAQLMSRHWIITDAFGHTEEVRGPGVVGLQPRLMPGQSFEYESACPLTTNTGSMRGTYHFTDDNGEDFNVDIPEFFLISPHAIH